MFLWRKDKFLEEMKKYSEDIYNKLININPNEMEEIRKIYSEVEKISIDYALLEKSKDVYTLKAEYEWSDVGNWVSVREMEGYSDKEKNVYLYDSKNVFVKSGKNIGIIGLENIVVIETESGILIADDEKVNEIKEIVAKLKNEDKF